MKRLPAISPQLGQVAAGIRHYAAMHPPHVVTDWTRAIAAEELLHQATGFLAELLTSPPDEITDYAAREFLELFTAPASPTPPTTTTDEPHPEARTARSCPEGGD